MIVNVCTTYKAIGVPSPHCQGAKVNYDSEHVGMSFSLLNKKCVNYFCLRGVTF